MVDVDKLDVAFIFCRKEIEYVKETVEFIRVLNDSYANIILVANYESQKITEEEFSYIDPYNYCEKINIPNEDLESICKIIGYKDLNHYYHITSCVFEWLRVNLHKRKNKADAWVWFEPDMIPMSSNWAKMLYMKWRESNKPEVLGQWWHGNSFAGLAPTILGLYSYALSYADIKWGGWGAFDREMLYELNRLKLRFVATDMILYTKEFRNWYDTTSHLEDFGTDKDFCMSKFFDTKISILHNIEFKHVSNSIIIQNITKRLDAATTSPHPA